MPLPTTIFSHRPYWAARFGIAPVLPMGRDEMDALGWDSCDIIIVTGDAYVDHPSFGMALIGRLLEAQGFRVGIIAQPDWSNAEAFRQLGRPNLFFGITAGNMDSMVNRYTADRRIRSDDAYTPNGKVGKRPDRSVIVYAQRAREAYKGVPVIIGGIEASLRRIAHYDYWSDKVRRSILPDAKADLLIYGNAERAIVEVAHRLAGGEKIDQIRDIRGSAFMRQGLPDDWREIDSSQLDKPGPKAHQPDPYRAEPDCQKVGSFTPHSRPRQLPRERTVVRLPSYDQVLEDEVIYAHASRVFHLETNPGNARALVQKHGKRDVWLNPPPIPLSTEELDRVYELPYTRRPHPAYGEARNPAWEMIRHSVNIMRGCFGGCTFCSITEHEGRIIQSRSEDSIVREVETIRDQVPGFSGNISDLGGPTANMYRLACKDKKIESACRRLSCVYPIICKNLNTDHQPLIDLYRRTRKLPGIKRLFVSSGLRYDLAIRSPDYIRELVTHHVGGYLKIAPEHTEASPLSMMMKPGIDSYEQFKKLFDKYSAEAGKEQYLIPYFIAAHPGTSDQDMLNLALWLKANGFRPDQVQAFLPTPLAIASAMYHTGRNPLKKITRRQAGMRIVRGLKQRRLHKAFLRYHDPKNWPLLREALTHMGRTDLIGKGKKHLVPGWQPNRDGNNNRSEKAFRSGSSRHPKKSSIQGNNVSRKKGRQR
ncbi:MAG: YgiQ family radical SAM protein [Candidatus Thiodiazotropha sp. (ex Lucinoma kastoroae)]|nr:YgiQ family radical SAM protein [Candidatus Thiodiazotropha sp. (ex Lucinoma kastoroae)]